MNPMVQPIITAIIFAIYVFIVDNFIIPTPFDVDMNEVAVNIVMAIIAMV